MIQLDLRTLLPLTRKAFDAGALQAQTADPGNCRCLYAGPCAIGVGLTPEQRVKLDAQTCPIIGGLISSGHIVVPDEQITDFVALQHAHDLVIARMPELRQPLSSFEAKLVELEAKYAQA